jgi:hypothetical protein
MRCAAAVEFQRGMAERNMPVAPERRIQFRIGITLATSSSTAATSSATA